METSVSCPLDYLNEVVKHYYGQNLVSAYLFCLSFFKLAVTSLEMKYLLRISHTCLFDYLINFYANQNRQGHCRQRFRFSGEKSNITIIS